jgi:hypothetical protein
MPVARIAERGSVKTDREVSKQLSGSVRGKQMLEIKSYAWDNIE